ncbi:MAG: hypothetical protein KDD47_04315 [Acidobacteria bacterium]|nr:hypothetical protein [Acidobacteriota bacterium]
MGRNRQIARRVGGVPAGRPRRQTIRRNAQDNVRVAAAWVVERTLDSLAPVDSFLETVLARYDDRDQALLREIVFGTLRWLKRIDYVVETAANRRLSEIEAVLHGTLRVAVYQLLFLDRIPSHAAVNEAVEQAHCLSHRGAASFVNAVLRRVAREPHLDRWPVKEEDPARRLAIEMSHPESLVRKWLERFGETRTLTMLRANNQPKPLQLLAFRQRGGRELLAEGLIDEGLEVEPSEISPLGLTVRRGNPLHTQAFERGECYVQDEISQMAALLRLPRAGERILDVASAPGGKAFALWGWEPEVQPLLSDVSASRLAVLRRNLRRLKLDFPLLLADAGCPPWSEQAAFDRVVVDLPCSGTGTLRKNPEIKWRLSERELERLSEQGESMLRGCADAVASGGILQAVTCSVEAEENERVIERFLATRGDFRRVALEKEIAANLLGFVEGPGLWRVLPGGNHDGFTVHLLERQ